MKFCRELIWVMAVLFGTAVFAELRISEICPRPDAKDPNGKESGWIELYNSGDEAVDLADYEIVRANRGKALKASGKMLASRTVEAHAYTVVYTSEEYDNVDSGVPAVYANDVMVYPTKVNPKKFPLVALYKGSTLLEKVVVPVDLPDNQSIAPCGGCFPGYNGVSPVDPSQPIPVDATPIDIAGAISVDSESGIAESGGAYDFAGVTGLNKGVKVASSATAALCSTNTWSVKFDFKMKSHTSGNPAPLFFCRTSSGNDMAGIVIYMDQEDVISVELRNAGKTTETLEVSVSDKWYDSEWHTLEFTSSGDCQTRIALAIDGVTYIDSSSTVKASLVSTLPVCFGHSYDSSYWTKFDGAIKDIAFYRGTLVGRDAQSSQAQAAQAELSDKYAIATAGAVSRVILKTITKGAVNNRSGETPYGPNAGPLYGVKHSLSDWEPHAPAVPGEDYVVSMYLNPLSDAASDALASARLLYRSFGSNGAFSSIAAVEMTKVGEPDAAAGQLWTGTIPASALPPAGYLIQWAAQVTDASGNVWRTPSFRNEEDGYQWYGTIVEPTAAQVSATLQTWHMFADSTSKGKMDSQYDSIKGSLPLGARVAIFDSQTSNYYDNVRIDLRGNTTANMSKKSHGLKFSKVHPMKCVDPFSGEKIEVRKTSIIAEHADVSRVRSSLSMKMRRLAGQDVPFGYPIRVQLNGEFYQLDHHTNRFTDELLEDYFGYDPFGYAYKNCGTVGGTYTGGGGEAKQILPDDGTNVSSAYQAFKSSISDVAAFTPNVSELSADTAKKVSKAVVRQYDLPAWLNFLALARLTQECDDGWANLCLYYDRLGTGTWRPMAYDLHQSFGAYYALDNYTNPQRKGLWADDDQYGKCHPLYGGMHVVTDHFKSNTAYGNRAIEAVYQSAKFRRLHNRRLRTLMDQILKEPGTSQADTPFWRDIVQPMVDAMQAEDAQDRQKWPIPTGATIYVWDKSLTFDQGVQDLWDNYFVKRRTHFFVTHSVTNTAKAIGYANDKNAGIPLAQSATSALKAGFSVEAVTGGAVIRNANAETVDMSGWKLSGAVEYTFPAGSVIDQAFGGTPGEVFVVTDRIGYIAANDSSLTDQIILGNAIAVEAEGFMLKDAAGETVVEPPVPTETFYTGDYDEPVVLGIPGEYVLSNANFNAGLVVPNDSKVKIVAETNTVNTIASIAAAKAEVSFTGDGTVKLTGADTLVTVSNLVVKSGTLEIKSTGVEKTKTPVVNVLGFVEQSGGVIDIDLDVSTTNQIYGIYVANKNFYAEFAGGELNATIGGGKSAAVYVNKGSSDTVFKGGEKITAVLKGTESRVVNVAGDLEFKNCEATVTLEGSGDAVAGARVFKSDKDIVISDGEARFDVDVTAGSDCEVFSAGDTITVVDGVFELAASDDCFSALNRIVVNGGRFYAVSTENDVFDSNGDMEINGGTILAYTTAEGHEAFDVDPELTEEGEFGHQLRVNGGTVFATGGRNAEWPTNVALAAGVAVRNLEDATASDYSGKYLKLTSSFGVNYVAKLPEFPAAKCAVFATCPYFTGTADVLNAAPESGDRDFHDLYVYMDADPNQSALRFYEIYGATLTNAVDSSGDTGEYIVLTNISDRVVSLAGLQVNVEKLKDWDEGGESLSKCRFTLASGEVAAYGSVRFDKEDYWSGSKKKITNGEIHIELTDVLGGCVQYGKASFDNAKYPETDLLGASLIAIRFDTQMKDNVSYWSSSASSHVHTWGEPEYVWADDFSTCTAVATCTQKSFHVTNEVVSTTYAVTQPATTEDTGIGTYTATFAGAMFTTQTKNVTLPVLPNPGDIGAYLHYVNFTVAGYTGASTLERFPVLVRLAANSPSGFKYSDCAADGADVRFSDADFNPIPHEIEKWNPNGESLVWVLLPAMANGTEFKMFFAGTPLAANDPTAVWTDYTGVWHMSEASGTVRDSTGHGLNAVPGGAQASDSVAYANGPAGNARQFATAKGNKTYLSVPSYDSFGLGGNFTVQGWFKATACFDSYSARYMSRKDHYQDGNGWEFEQRYGSGTTPSTIVSCRGAASGDAVQTVPDITAAWLDLALNYNGANVQYYVNGAAGSKVSVTAATDNQKPLVFGNCSTGTESNWVGQMDEIRLRKGDVTADRMLGEHETIADAAFLSAGAVQTIPQDKPVLGEVSVMVRATTATLSGSIDILGDGATACDVYFAYGTDENVLIQSTKIKSGITGAFEHELDGLTASTTYYYELSVTNNAETAAGAVKHGSFTTEAPPAPPAFGAVEVRAKSRKAVFAGSIASVGNDGASSCDVYLSIDGAAATKIVEGVTGAFNYTVIGLELDTTYAYTLSISNDADTVRGASLSGSFTTLATEEGLQPVAGDAAATRSLIQEAIDDAALESPAGTVILGEGIFEIDETLNVTGGVSLVGQGSDLTTIKPGASAKIRCVMIDNGAKLEGVTLTGGNAAYGAGAWVRNGTVSWCRIENCYGFDTSNGFGAGVSFTQGQGQIDHCTVTGCSGNTNFRGVGIGSYQQAGAVLVDTCLIFGNKTPTTTGWGAAVGMKDMSADTTVRNCTISGNQSQMYGSVYGEGGSGKLILVNDIIVGNKLNNGDEMNIKSDSGALDKTNSKNCFFGLGTEAAVIPVSFSGDPMFTDAANGDYRLMEGSPAFGKGASYSGIGVDLAGSDFADPPSIGCFEFGNFAASPVFSPESSVFNDPISVTISCRTDGATIRYTTDESDPTEASALYDGPVVITDTTTFKAVAFKIGKDPSPVVTKTYVHKDGILPGATPAETTKTIQDAIDAAAAESPAGTVVLSASLFEIDAQLFVTNGVTLLGVGADKTIIKQTTSGTSARCVQVRSGAKLVGLTLTGGRMTSNWNYGAAALVDNGTISWCCISNNVSTGNNLYGGALSIEGDATIDHTVIAENTASGMTDFGGAIGSYNKSYSLVIDTCLIYGNSAPNSGNGGGYGGAIAFRGGKPNVEIRNTTITGNSAITDGGAISFDGNASVKLVNCIVSGNLVNGIENNIAGTLADGSEGNLIGGNPGFVNAAKGNYRLKLTSSAVGIGKTYSGIAEDLDKVARKNPPAAGCYEVGDTPIYEPGWTAQALTADPSGICTDGDLVYAYARGDYMVNGVAFSGVGSSVLAIDNANVSWTGFSMTAGCTYGDVEDAGYKGLLENSWACMHTYSHTVTLKNLTVGKTYLVQFIGARNNGSNDAQIWVDESGDDSIFIKAGGTGWSYGGTLTGIFEAEATTKEITLKFVDSHQDWTSWNGLQVRELAVSPTSALPTYIQGQPQEVIDRYKAWAKVYGEDTESAYESSFLLNCGTASEALAAAMADFRIVSISRDASTGEWECEVTGGVAVGGRYGNGYVSIVSVKDGFTGAGGSSDFFKARLEFVAPED